MHWIRSPGGGSAPVWVKEVSDRRAEVTDDGFWAVYGPPNVPGRPLWQGGAPDADAGMRMADMHLEEGLPSDRA